MKEIETTEGKRRLDQLPSKCPFCHHAVTPDVIYGYVNKSNEILEVFMTCPNSNCYSSFIGYYRYYDRDYSIYLNKTSLGNLIEKDFNDLIKNVSSSFVKIYNQALSSEQRGLNEICGVGYRKALEYLIKDYTIQINISEKESIEKMFLSNVIDKYVTDTRVKTVAKRAVWLGNDETHYIRKWEGKNLNDLKSLIDLTVHWIEMEFLTKDSEVEMPD